MPLKMDSYLRPFKAKGDNFEALWAEFEVFAEIQTWGSDYKKMTNFPLFLEF